MQTFEIKTHRKGKTYTKPHFFILNKGFNSGKPMKVPCPNCFVVSTPTLVQKQALFHLSMILLESKRYRIYLKGSVIPFISIYDVEKLLKNNYKYLNESEFKSKLNTLKKVENLELLFQKKLNATQELKSVLLRSFKLEP